MRIRDGSRKALLCLLLGLSCAGPAVVSGFTYYVATTGNDGGPGSPERPFATIQRAADQARAGDDVVVRGGTYRITREIRPRYSGLPDRWIVYRGQAGEDAIIDAEGFVKTEPEGYPPSRRQLGAFQLEKVSYVRVEHLRVRDARFAGFNVMGRETHHIELIDCRVDGSYGPGIFLRDGPDQCRVIGCEITGANNQALRAPGEHLESEAPHEALSIAWATRFEIASNNVHDCFKEGIDCKEQSAIGVIHDNRVHNLPRQGLYVDCWFGRLTDVEFRSNVSYSNEWGMAISAEGQGASMDHIRIHHNVFRDNRASGIYFGTWGANGPRSDIWIYQNTVYQNGHVKHWAGATGGIDVRAENLRRVLIVNNIVFDNAAWEIATFAPPQKRDEILDARGIIVANNLTGPYHDLSSEGGLYNRPYADPGRQTLQADPMFVGLKAGDFRLRPGSPAIGAARALLPIASGPDLGALPVAR